MLSSSSRLRRVAGSMISAASRSSVVMDSRWALFAARFRGMLAGHGRLRNRLTGGVFIAAGLGLAAARRAA